MKAMKSTIIAIAASLTIPLPVRAAAEREIRIFDVRPLVYSPTEGRMPFGRLPGSILLASPDTEDVESGELCPFTPEAAPTCVISEMELLGEGEVPPDTLVGLIKSLIAEDSWANERNSIEWADGKLMVVQTPDVIREVEAFIADLVAVRMRRVEIRVAVVPPAALARAIDAAKAPADSPWLPASVIDDALEAAGDDGFEWRATAAEGETVAFPPISRAAAVIDIEINQTGVEPAENPVIGLLRGEFGVKFRASSMPLRGWYEIRCTLSRIKEVPEGRRATPSGDVDLIGGSGVQMAGSAPARAGETVFLGELAWPRKEPASLALLARVRRVLSRVPLEAGPVRFLDAGILVRPWPVIQMADLAGQTRAFSFGASEERPQGLYTIEHLIDKAMAALPAGLPNDPRTRMDSVGSRLFVTVIGDRAATARAAAAVEAMLARLCEALVGAADFRLFLGSIDGAALAELTDPDPGATILSPDWRSAIDPARGTAVRIVGFADQPLQLWAASGRTFLSDIERVSGGTGFILTEAADPIFEWAGTGIQFRAFVRPVPGNPWIQIGLKGAAAETTFGKTLFLRADERVERDARGEIQATGQRIDIDLPEQKAQTWKHYVTVPAGRACLLATAPDPADPKMIQILVAEGRVLPLRAE